MSTPTHLLNRDAVIKAQVWVSDGRGGKRETYAPRPGGTVRVMVSQPREDVRETAGAIGANIDGWLYFKPDALVEIGDRIAVVGDDEGEWRVESVVTDSRTTLKRANCKRRQLEDGAA